MAAASSSSSSFSLPRPGSLRGAPRSLASSAGGAVEDDDAMARRLQQEFDDEVSAKEARERFFCEVCQETHHIEASVEFDCLHRLCTECVTGYLEIKITEKRVDDGELCCPMPGCGREITVPQIEGATRGTPMWYRYLECKFERYRPEGDEAGDRMVGCPSPACQEAGIRYQVPPGPPMEVLCPSCQCHFCSNCGGAHSLTVSCVAHAAAVRKLSPEDEAFEALVREKRWQRCPHCQVVTERPTGCNYMTCKSEVCRGKTCFCYLCGEKLCSTEHLCHFPYGPFQNACIRVDRRDDESLPQASWGTQEWWTLVVQDVKASVFGQ